MATRLIEHREIFRQISGHVYLIRYAPGREDEAADAIYRWVNDEDLDFGWRDAAVMGSQLGAAGIG